MDEDALATLRRLEDRQDILDCLVRYCRGIDRFDRALLLSAYHPDAIDDHGAYVGGPEGFADYYLAYHAHYQHRTLHSLGTHTCEIDGDTAHCETYWTFSGVNKEQPYVRRSTGRYIDRLERRGGEWKIAARICVMNSVSADPPAVPDDAPFVPPARDRSDPSYMRPLVIDPARINNAVFRPA